MLEGSSFDSGERGWEDGEAHELAVSSVQEARREIAMDSLERSALVSQRAFRPYVYNSIDGAGTLLESALRNADSRVLVARPRRPEALGDGCLDGFEGFGAGAGDVSGIRLGGAAGPVAAARADKEGCVGSSAFFGATATTKAPSAPLVTAASPAPEAGSGVIGLFGLSTRPMMSGGCFR